MSEHSFHLANRLPSRQIFLLFLKPGLLLLNSYSLSSRALIKGASCSLQGPPHILFLKRNTHTHTPKEKPNFSISNVSENCYLTAVLNPWLMSPEPCQKPGFDTQLILRSEDINTVWHRDTNRQ